LLEPFHHPSTTGVVAEALKVAIQVIQCDRSAGEEFEADCLCPSNMAAL
jgi:hypothetical protein